MTIKAMLEDGEILALLSLASHSALYLENGYQFKSSVDQMQFQFAADNAAKILAKVDRISPGLVPLPHDNVPWAGRVPEDDE